MTKRAAAPPAMTSTELAKLKAELETKDDSVFEEMSAHLFSRLLDDIAVTVSKTGSQFGGDAGTAGLRGRRLRVECKRYRETTKLDPRGLAGEVMEAVLRDPLIETWVLMSTKEVTETERNLALGAGEKLGVPILVFDWTTQAAGAGLCSLAALCATWPDVVEDHAGKKAADAAHTLTPYVGAAIDNLRKDLKFWNIGFRSLREGSVEQLQRVWKDRAEALAVLNQDAAGGRSGVHLISRTGPLQQLKDWWQSTVKMKSPVVVTGLEGVGKTWVALDWANKSIDELPIVVLVPASAFVNSYYLSEGGLRDLFVKHLRSATNSNLSEEYWRARVNNLLQRPPTEGPVILLIVDGLNQQPHVSWLALGQTLQGTSFAGRARLLATARRTYFDLDLRRLGALDSKPSEVPVGPYDQDELDELLRHHVMTRADMHPGLIKLASVPRLFPLVYKLKDNVALQSEASVHRLLFEYGRDVLQEGQQSTLTDESWVAWLVDRAREYHQKIPQTKLLAQPHTYTEVATSVGGPHLSPEEVARRLSDVVDGGFFVKTKCGITTKLVLQEDAAILALALALVDTLSGLPSNDFDVVQPELERWLEPVAAIDQVTEVLRAALAVSSATQGADGQGVVDSLLVTWMNAQNPTASFAQELQMFGDAFPRSMLAVVERSGRRSQLGVLYFAVQSLRRLPTQRTEDWAVIIERMKAWASWVHVPKPEEVADPKHYAHRHYKQLVDRIGTATPGTKVVLGAQLKLAYQRLGDPAAAIPSILEGRDLTAFASVLQTAAIREAVQVDHSSRCWYGLTWLALMGSTDEIKTRSLLQQLAKEALKLKTETDVHERLRNRVSALLLRLTGDEPCEIDARAIDEKLGGGWDYTKDYLDSPGTSFFALEHRHLQSVLEDKTLQPVQRLGKLKPFLADPDVTLPSDLAAVVQAALTVESFKGIDEGGQFTIEESRYENLEAVAARFLPVVYVETTRRRLRILSSRSGDQKYWAAYRAPQLLLAARSAESEAFRALRISTTLTTHERVANTWALQIELLHKPLEQQLAVLLNAENYYYTIDLMAVIRPATALQLLAFLDGNVAQARKAAHVTMVVMAYQLPEDADQIAERLLTYLVDSDEELRAAAFVALSCCAPEVCGRKLLAINWKPELGEAITAHYGSHAVGRASQHFGFTDVLPMVAPWRWLDVAVARGGNVDELQTASKYLLGLLKASGSDMPELNATVSMRAPDPGELARLSVSETPKADTLGELHQMSQSVDELNRRMRELAREAGANIEKIRGSGHALYLHAFSKESIRSAYLAARADWEEILNGAENLSPNFVQRVRSAEGLFTALCEVLLELDPPKGAILWRALRACVHTQMTGKAGIPELIHILFRAPPTTDVIALRQDLTSSANANTDRALVDLVIAAEVNGQDSWLAELVKADTVAPQLWRRKRAIVLDALRTYPELDKLVWPEGDSTSTWQGLRKRMAEWTNRGAFARYWWDRFATASSAEDAYCAWTVFLTCADRRAYVWMDAMMDKADRGCELDRLRRLQIRLNRDLLERALLKQEDKSPKLSEKLFSFDAPREWLQLDGVTF